jgi:transcription initiation factor TFIIIB Brf1 subunit/transcription initiation factor TFIIB
MKYDLPTTLKIQADYQAGQPVTEIAKLLGVPERSIIAKLSSLGIYRKKEYLTKRGLIPVKKEEYIERIAKLLNVNSDVLESLDKVNKSVLMLLEQSLTQNTQIDPKL